MEGPSITAGSNPHKGTKSDVTSSEDASPFSNSAVPQADIIQSVSSLFTMQELLNLLPPKQEADRLVASWFNSPEPLKLIVHAPTFHDEYHAFWLDPVAVSPAWLALLFAICSLGAEISGQLPNDADTLSRAEDFRRLVSHALILSDYMSKPQPYTIEAIQLQVKSLLLKRYDSSPAAWHLHGQAMRMMFLAGYHRDPGDNPANSPFHCEMKRRVWMFAYEYDVLVSYQLGVISLLNRNMCDTKPPLNLKDTGLSQDTVPLARSLGEYTSILMELHHIQLVEIYGETLTLSHSVTASANAAVGALQVRTLQERLSNTRDSLPQVLKTIPMSQAFRDPPELILDRFRLESLFWKAMCVLYRPFVGKTGHHEARARGLSALLCLIRCQIPVLEAAQPGEQLASSAVFLSRHVHDFNFAAMLCCYELMRTPRKIESGWSESQKKDLCSMVLRACGLWNILGVTSPKARHALRATEQFLLQYAEDSNSGVTACTATRKDNDGLAQCEDRVPARSFANPDFSTPTGADFDYMAPFDTSAGPAEEMNVEQDRMFQEVFGLTH